MPTPRKRVYSRSPPVSDTDDTGEWRGSLPAVLLPAFCMADYSSPREKVHRSSRSAEGIGTIPRKRQMKSPSAGGSLRATAVICSLAVLANLLATVVRLALAPLFGSAVPFLTYFIVALVVVWYRGFRAAVLTIVLAAFAGSYLFVSPTGTVSIFTIFATGFERATVGGFVFASLIVCFLVDLQRRTLERLHSEADRRKAAELAETHQRSRAENASRLLASIVQCSDDAIISEDLNGMITSWNQGAQRIFGYCEDEIIGRPLALLAPANCANETRDILERMKREGRMEHVETLRQTKQGRLVHVAVTISPLFDATGKMVGVSGIARDITARKQAEEELRTMNATLERANEDLERFAFVASHDLQEPLRMIHTFAELLVKRLPPPLDPALAMLVEQIVEGSQRMHEVTRRFARICRNGGAGRVA